MNITSFDAGRNVFNYLTGRFYKIESVSGGSVTLSGFDGVTHCNIDGTVDGGSAQIYFWGIPSISAPGRVEGVLYSFKCWVYGRRASPTAQLETMHIVDNGGSRPEVSGWTYLQEVSFSGTESVMHDL